MSMPGLHEISYLFWDASQKDALEILDKYGIDYILIENNRIYDDSQHKHTGGYPRAFLDKISNFDRFKKVFENEGAQIWKIEK